ncbi:hypothetical protein ACVWYF_004194 [Hymenobacter sp. UYAg731]
MQNLTFTQKLLRQRRFLSSLIPLLALFLGIGLPNKAYAQPTGASTATIRNVYVTAGASAAAATTNTYDAIATTGGTGIGGGIFAGTNFGSLDVSAGRLLLQGGKVEINETAGEVYSRAFITFGVVAGTIAAGPNPTLNQTVELVQTGFSAGVRTFELTTAARDILMLATTAGSPGTSYRFDVAVNALGEDAGGDPVSTAGTASRRRSVFTATGTPASSSVKANTIQVAPNGGSNVTFYFNSASTPQFSGADLSSPTNGGNSYDINTGRLLLTGTTVTTTEAGSSTINNVVLYYRTRLGTDPGGAYQAITLTQSSGANGGTKTFVLDPNSGAAQPNLIATPAVKAPGTYTVDVYYQANGTANGTPFAIVDPPTGAYSANFMVNGTPIAQTIWTGGKNDNWFDMDNWTNGVPTASTNALVRDLGTGNANAYPNIYSDSKKLTAGGAVVYDNTGSGPALTRDFVMAGTSQAQRSIARLIQGQLIVYGNFSNNLDSFIQRENTDITFGANGASDNPTGNQTITGGTFVAVTIAGIGKKSLAGTMTVSQSVTFNGGILATDITQPDISAIVLADRDIVNNNNGAQLINESEQSYIYGFVRTSRAGVLVGEARTYGEIGLAITFTGTNNPGKVDVTRNTVEAYSPVNGRYGIRRIFGVRPADAATNSGGLSATFYFHYLDRETMNLGGVNTRTPGSGSIPEANLALFVSNTSGNTFSYLGRDIAVDQTNNIVTKSGVTNFATFTLGDTEKPLPVRLTAFDAKRIGSDALVTWQTASEENSKGYEVQVSTNGTEYRTLASIPSVSPNTTQVTNYSYVDKEANKTGKRYYRLHQLDLDGKDAFFAPTVVSFEGKAPSSNFVAYPNPLNAGNELHVALQSAATGTAKLLVTDMTGRTLQQQNVVLTGSLTDTSVAGMGDLKAGVYLMKITLPTGEVKNLKVVKQ